MRMRKKVCFVLMIVWMIVIFAFSSRNADLSTQDSHSIGMLLGRLILPTFQNLDADRQLSFANKVDHPVRKLAHMAEYAVLGLLISGSYTDRTKKWLDRIRVPFIIGAVYAVSDEVHQMFVPGRSCEVKDMMIDSSGVLIGVLFGMVVWRKTRENKED